MIFKGMRHGTKVGQARI